ncbi:hypothetical protein [Nostoc sp. NOS(2021)]|nr:hypothetical protein [Nostoc sp. NOS(2021)]
MKGVILAANALIWARQTVPHQWDFDQIAIGHLGAILQQKDQ